ncbi:SRPBCC family protein [Compostimonas suwonensis]|uniref:Activator of Hsp90 ATPase-like protein n=1 Tax=Compostimonas suwonensis TaxID=1048394 RepID=A0A2M9C581_9MICO|nr:SRPBCC domain-containing protein [Compostimonas suwonensis]PJJ65685.1 activator of Hsp90 ATPase-like protein [Compostimonas suwonensis]
MADTTGLTKDAGWEMGARRTFPVPLAHAWNTLLGPALPTWLGVDSLGTTVGEEYTTVDGTRGRLRSYTEGKRLRLSWQPAEWTHDSTLQLTVLPAASGTTIAFHHERLAGREERKQMLTHWHGVLDSLETQLG